LYSFLPAKPVVAVGGLDDAAGRGQRGRSLIEGRGRTRHSDRNFSEGKRRSGIGKSCRDAFV
jgi:hypothetical protein